jgi:hypothetical protein
VQQQTHVVGVSECMRHLLVTAGSSTDHDTACRLFREIEEGTVDQPSGVAGLQLYGRQAWE